MTRLVALLLMAGCAALVGCGEYKSAPVAPPAGPGQAGQPAGAQATAPAAATQGTKPASMPIELSTGVALAQTLPEGTSMSFSVDYRVAKDAKVDPKAKYVWVIERSGGGTADPQRGTADAAGYAADHYAVASGRRAVSVAHRR